MRPIDTITLLMDSKADHKSVIRTAWMADSEEFFIGLDMAVGNLDFGLDKVPAIEDEDDDDPGSFTFSDFYVLAMKLANRDLVGEEAIAAVSAAAMIANANEWNLWYRKILLKNLAKSLPMAVIQKELIRLTTE